MFKKTTFIYVFILIAFSAVFTYRGYPHKNYSNWGASTYADVKGEVNWDAAHVGSNVHIHGIAYSWDDRHKGGEHAVGDYTVTLKVSTEENVWDDDWWDEAYDKICSPEPLVNNFFEGCHVEDDITFFAKGLSDVRAIAYKASSTVRNKLGIERDMIKKRINKFAEDEEVEVGMGLTPSDGIYTASAGDTHESTLNTGEPYYSVNWFVKKPGDTSDYGTSVKYDFGNGTRTTDSLSYTFPCGIRGDYVITAIAYRWTDMSLIDEISYTVSVSAPTVPDRPASFELTPHKIAILLRWTDSESDGDSPITDYQYQWEVSYNNRRSWSGWSDWISAGTGNSTWLTGLYKGKDYAFRMRAVNAVGTSNVTGIKIVKTKK